MKKKEVDKVLRKKLAEKDISNKTVLLFLVIVIVVSVICLGVFVSKISDANPKVTLKNQGKGELKLNIGVAPANGAAPAEPKSTDAKITMEVKKPVVKKEVKSNTTPAPTETGK